MKRVKSFGLICLFGLLSITASAQSEVATTALLYNAPYRHFINPAFEPITEGYLYLPAISHISLYGGNNSLSLSDLVIDNNGTSMWTLNPNSGVNLLDAFRKNTLVNANVNLALLGFGWRTRRGGYLHFNLNERIDAGVTLPKDLFQFVLGGGMTDFTNGNVFSLNVNHYDDRTLASWKHIVDYKDSDVIYVNIDGFLGGIGSNSCGPLPEKNYRIPSGMPLRYSFIISPVFPKKK